jgi:lysozyme
MKIILTLLVFIYSFTTLLGQRTSPAGIKFIMKFEGCRLVAYKDLAGVITIGCGDTRINAVLGRIITKDQAEKDLAENIRYFEKKINAKITRSLHQYQFDAIIDLTYNAGSGVLKGGLLIDLNKGSPAVSNRLRSFNKAHINGKLTVVRGLTRRCNARARLYESGKYN